jgi:hypothetical protein
VGSLEVAEQPAGVSLLYSAAQVDELTMGAVISKKVLGLSA